MLSPLLQTVFPNVHIDVCMRNSQKGFCEKHFTAQNVMFCFLQDVLKKLLEYANDCLGSTDPDSSCRMEVLGMLSKLILCKRPESRDGLYRALHQYPLTLKSQRYVEVMLLLLFLKLILTYLLKLTGNPFCI